MKRKFTLLIAALALLTMIVQPGRAWGQSGTLVFDFEEDSAHRTSGNNSFTSNTYSENGVTISLTYADAVTSGNPISGTANMMGRVAKNTTNSPSMIIGPIDISNWNTVTSVEFKTNGPNTITEKFYVSTNGTNYTEKLSFTLNTTTATKTADELEISGDNLYLKWTGSVGSSTGSNRDFRIDDITISYTTGSSTTYTVTYNANGATSGNVPTDASSPYESGATVTVLGNTGSLAKTGHSFNNWNTNANGTGTSYSEGNTFTISSNTILFAQWTANTHNVTIPATDTYGSYEMDQTNPVAYGTEVTLTYTPASGYSGYTATWSANNTPLAGNTFTMPDEDVTVSVEVAPYEQPTTVYIDMNYQWLGSTNGGNLSPDQLPVIKIDDNVTTTITDGTSTHPRGDTDYIRIYKGSTLTFAAPDGYNITQIVFTTGGNNTWNAPSVSSGTLSDKTWTGNAESVTFDLSGSCFISMATIDLGQSSLPTPTVTIDATGITNTNVFAGTEAGSLSASVTYEETPVEGATVTWSGNNDNVATISETTGAVTLVAAGSVTFTATFAGNASYNGASKNYEMTVTNFDPDGPGTQNNPYTVAQAIENTPTSGTTGDVYIHGRVSAFYNNNTTILDDNSHRYYISDDGSTSSQLLVYNGKGLNNVAFSNVDDLLIGDEITLVGKLKTYSNAPEVDGGNYIVSLVRPSAPVATPTFNPEAGVYTEAQNVEISCETEGSTIYYTTDGTEPTNASTEYTGAISVTETTTIKAIAYVGEEYSSVATATYTIQAPLATMDEIMAAATAAGLTPTNVNINFNNWIVSGVGSNAKRAFVTDGTKGFIIYNNDGGLTFVRGDVLSGTKSCQVQLLNGAPCVKGLNASDFEITQTGQEPTVTTTTISALEAVNTGAVVNLGNLTWDGSKFVDNDNNSIYYYNTIYDGELTANTIYSVKGVYVQYSGNTPPKEIAPRDANDIVATPILATADVNIACDVTVGAITYTLENPVSGGTLTAAVTAGNEDNWLTLGEEIGANVPFTCTTNTGVERTATVTLTYTYNTTETITATAVVTQAAYVAPTASIVVTPTEVNATADETEGTITVTLTAIEDDNIEIVWFESDGETQATEPAWITAEVNVNNNIDYLIEENTGDARTAYFKVYGLDGDANDVYSELITINQAAPVADYATLPFEWVGSSTNGSSSLTSMNGVTASGLGSDYAASNAPYRIKLDGTGDYIQIKTNEQPGLVTLEVKMLGGAETSYITVQGSTDGETFDQGEALEISGAQNTELTLTSTRTFDEDVRYVRMVFTKGSNVGVGSITIAKAQPSIALNSSVTAPCTKTNGTLTVTYTDINTELVPSIYWYESDGTTQTDAPTWMDADVNTSTFNVDYLIEENEGAERKAYFKVYGIDNKGNDVYSNLVTVTQSEAQDLYTVTLAAKAYNQGTMVEIPFTGSITVSATSVAEGSEVTIIVDCAGDDGTHYRLESFSVVDADDNTYPLTFEKDGDVTTIHFEMPAVNVTVPMGIYKFFNVTAHFNGQSVSQEAISTTDFHMTAPTGFALAGWVWDETDYTEAGEQEFLTFSADDQEVWAVFQRRVGGTKNRFAKITSTDELAAGYYLIVCESENVAFNGGLETLDVAGNKIDVEIEDDAIITTTENIAACFAIYLNASNYYSIVSYSNSKFIGRATNKNGLDTSDEDLNNEINFDADGNANIAGTGGPTLRYNKSVDQKRFRYYTSGQQPIQLYKYVPGTGGNIEYCTRVFVGTNNMATLSLSAPAVVTNNALLNVTGEWTNTYANYLIIDEGGQLKTSSAVNATVRREIHKAPTWNSTESSNDGWYTISSPINGNLAATDVTGLLTTGDGNDFDLYKYDEVNSYWRTYKEAGTQNAFNIEPGTGYLYASQAGTMIEFAGEINKGDVDCALTAGGAAPLTGFNLIGNPYSHNIYKGHAIPNDILASGYYILSKNGGWITKTDDDAIAPSQGILVKATTAGDITMTSTMEGPSAKSYHDNIKFMVSNNQYEDIAYAWFDKGVGLNKINHRNADIPMLYIPQNDKNYAIATMDDNTQAFNLNFKAMTTGQYTLSFKAQGSYSYLHVIDRITGEDIDMLLDGEYTFIGSPRDNENRFIVKLNYNANIDELEAGDSFAYQYGNGIIVNGKGELQVFDVNGRMVMNTVINGKQTVNIPTTGLYIFRMVGESVKTQKIVVR